ncbi:MAG: hypothetical protein AAGH99_02110 [Planctomycetota bacterium]
MKDRFRVQDVDIVAERRKRRRKKITWSMIGTAIITMAAAAGWYLTPPAMPETIEEARLLVNSLRFDRLSKQAKQPYLDVIREQYGSLDHDERQRLREEDEKLRDAMRDARNIQFRAMLVGLAEMDPDQRAEMMQRFGPPRRPERTPEEEAEQSERLRNFIGDRVANGDSQMNQLMREMFSQRRRQNANR